MVGTKNNFLFSGKIGRLLATGNATSCPRQFPTPCQQFFRLGFGSSLPAGN
jgi:hypothetical protein